MTKPTLQINEVIRIITRSELHFKIAEWENGMFKEFGEIIKLRRLADDEGQ